MTELGRDPLWLSDGKHLLYRGDRVFDPRLYLLDLERGETTPLSGREVEITSFAFAPGERFIYASVRRAEADLWLVTFETEPE